MLISEAFEQYNNEEVIGTGGSPRTCEAYHYALKAFLAEWGNVPMESINLAMIKQFGYIFHVDQRSGEIVHSIGTVRDYLTCLRAVLKMCKIRGLDVLPPEAIHLPKREKKTPLCLEENEVELLICAASQPCRGYPAVNRFRNELLIRMLYCTGLRISELCRLNITDIHNREFTVVGKSKEPRVCYITEELEYMIDKYIKMRTDSNPALFVSAQTGGKRLSPSTVQAVFRRLRRGLGVGKATPHTMRHSFCTRLLDHGVDIHHTAKLMGHQSWNTTKLYTHIKDRRLRSIYDSVIS